MVDVRPIFTVIPNQVWRLIVEIGALAIIRYEIDIKKKNCLCSRLSAASVPVDYNRPGTMATRRALPTEWPGPVGTQIGCMENKIH